MTTQNWDEESLVNQKEYEIQDLEYTIQLTQKQTRILKQELQNLNKKYSEL